MTELAAEGLEGPDGPDHDATEGDDTGTRRRHVSRWDRPPQPHDWRFYIGNLGRVLITTGLLMFGFVAYQLWGTGIETARSQNKLENQFETLLTATEDDRPVDETPTTAPPETTPPDDQDDPSPDAPLDDVVVPVAIDLSDQAVEQEPIPIVRGEVLARLEIPRIGATEYIVPGVTLDDLKKGPGHYPDTPLPGQLGNTAIAGHRTTYGAPFFDVDQLSAGDEIIFTMVNGDRFVYLVTGVEVVPASRYSVVTTTNPNIAEATLTSCDPKYTARNRIVVHSVLDPTQSSNVGVPTFYELDPPEIDEPIPGDDPVISADAGEPTDDVDAPADDSSDDAAAPADEQPNRDDVTSEAGDDSSDDAGETTDDVDAPADEESGDAVVAEPNDRPEPTDAFSQGWFDDRGAFSQIALWGALLIAIGVLSYQLSKRFRRYSVGILVGVVPFVVALYFFYQNVNRLLPPGI